MKKRTLALGITAALGVSYFAFADAIIKGMVEQQLTNSYGAEVNIGTFSHSLLNASVTMKDIQLTDHSAPMRNKIAVAAANAEIQIMPLLSGQAIIDNLTIKEMEFDTPRSSEGLVLAQPESNLTLEGILAQTSEALPSVDEVLARSPLKTTKAIEEANQAYEQHVVTLKDDYDALPKQERIDYYKKELAALKEVDFKNPQAIAQAKQKFEQILAEAKQDKAALVAFSDKAKAAKQAINASAVALKKAPQEDYTLLQGLVAGDSQAFHQLTQSLLGDEVAKYSDYLLYAFNTVVPMLTGGEGEPNQAPTASEAMSILVKHADVSVKWGEQTFSTDWENITNKHTEFGQPTTFVMSMLNASAETFSSSGEFWLDEKGIDAKQVWQLSNMALEQFPVSQSEGFSATIQQALLSSLGELSIEDNALSGTSNIDLAQLAMAAAGETTTTGIIADVLNGLSALDVKLDFDGQINAPALSISSDLDTQIMQAATSQLMNADQGKLAELKQKLNAKIAPQLASSEAGLGDIDQWLTLASGDENAINDVLSSQFDGLIKGKADKLLNGLFKKLGGSD